MFFSEAIKIFDFEENKYYSDQSDITNDEIKENGLWSEQKAANHYHTNSTQYSDSENTEAFLFTDSFDIGTGKFLQQNNINLTQRHKSHLLIENKDSAQTIFYSETNQFESSNFVLNTQIAKQNDNVYLKTLKQTNIFDGSKTQIKRKNQSYCATMPKTNHYIQNKEPQFLDSKHTDIMHHSSEISKRYSGLDLNCDTRLKYEEKGVCRISEREIMESEKNRTDFIGLKGCIRELKAKNSTDKDLRESKQNITEEIDKFIFNRNIKRREFMKTCTNSFDENKLFKCLNSNELINHEKIPASLSSYYDRCKSIGSFKEQVSGNHFKPVLSDNNAIIDSDLHQSCIDNQMSKNDLNIISDANKKYRMSSNFKSEKRNLLLIRSPMKLSYKRFKYSKNEFNSKVRKEKAFSDNMTAIHNKDMEQCYDRITSSNKFCLKFIKDRINRENQIKRKRVQAFKENNNIVIRDLNSLPQNHMNILTFFYSNFFYQTMHTFGLNSKIVQSAIYRFFDSLEEADTTLTKMFNFLPFILVTSYIYFIKYLKNLKCWKRDKKTFIKLFLTCCILSSKFWFDEHRIEDYEAYYVDSVYNDEVSVLSAIDFDLSLPLNEILFVIVHEKIAPHHVMFVFEDEERTYMKQTQKNMHENYPQRCCHFK